MDEASGTCGAGLAQFTKEHSPRPLACSGSPGADGEGGVVTSSLQEQAGSKPHRLPAMHNSHREVRVLAEVLGLQAHTLTLPGKDAYKRYF